MLWCGLAWNSDLETPPSPHLLRWSSRKGKRFPFDIFDVHPIGDTRSIRLCFRFLIKLIIQVCRAPGKSSCGFDNHWKPFVSRFLSSSPPKSPNNYNNPDTHSEQIYITLTPTFPFSIPAIKFKTLMYDRSSNPSLDNNFTKFFPSCDVCQQNPKNHDMPYMPHHNCFQNAQVRLLHHQLHSYCKGWNFQGGFEVPLHNLNHHFASAFSCAKPACTISHCFSCLFLTC